MKFEELRRALLWNPRALWKLVQQCIWLMNRHKWATLAANLYFLLIVIAGHFAVIPVARMITPHRRWQDILLTLLSMPLTAFAGRGLVLFYLHLVRNHETKLTELFSPVKPLRYFYNLLFLWLYYIIYVFLVKYQIYVEIERLMEEFVPKLQLFLGIILYIFFLSRFLFAPAYIMDHGLSTKSSFKYSLLLTSGRGLKTFIVTFTFVAILVLGALPAGALVLAWLWWELANWWLLCLIPTLLLFAWSMGPGAIAYIRMYDLYQQELPPLKELPPPPHPILIRRPNIEEEMEEERRVKRELRKKKRQEKKQRDEKRRHKGKSHSKNSGKTSRKK